MLSWILIHTITVHIRIIVLPGKLGLTEVDIYFFCEGGPENIFLKDIKKFSCPSKNIIDDQNNR